MTRFFWLMLLVIPAAAFPGLFMGCVDSGDSTPPSEGTSSQIDPGDPIVPSEGYSARKAEYFEYCFENNGPGQGGIHGQVCRIYGDADTFNEEKIDEALDEINAREDTADFELNSLLRMLYLYREHPTMGDALRERLESAVLNFKYWLDEPGPDEIRRISDH